MEALLIIGGLILWSLWLCNDDPRDELTGCHWACDGSHRWSSELMGSMGCRKP